MENISKEKWKKLVAETKGAIVIDVRTPVECLEGMQAIPTSPSTLL